MKRYIISVKRVSQHTKRKTFIPDGRFAFIIAVIIGVFIYLKMWLLLAVLSAIGMLIGAGLGLLYSTVWFTGDSRQIMLCRLLSIVSFIGIILCVIFDSYS